MSTVTFSILKSQEGGWGWYGMELLKAAGIPAKKGHTPYIGHIGIEVEKRYQKRASKILL